MYNLLRFVVPLARRVHCNGELIIFAVPLQMHSNSVEPIPLQESRSDYSYSGFSEYFPNGQPRYLPPQYYNRWGVDQYRMREPTKPIVPNGNDILMGRGEFR